MLGLNMVSQHADGLEGNKPGKQKPFIV